MSNRVLALSAAALMAAGVATAASVACAAPVTGGLAIAAAAGSDVDAVRWWGRGFGWGLGAGLLGGAIIGGALASPYYYGPYYAPGYYYGPPGPYYPGPAYGYPAPGYGGPAGYPSGYCAQKYRSYDPSTGTFLGKDGARHPCP